MTTTLTWRKRSSAGPCSPSRKTPCCGTIRACCWRAQQGCRRGRSLPHGHFLRANFAEPFAHLANLRARQGRLRDAVRWLEQAVTHAPQTAEYGQRLEAYRRRSLNLLRILK